LASSSSCHDRAGSPSNQAQGWRDALVAEGAQPSSRKVAGCLPVHTQNLNEDELSELRRRETLAPRSSAARSWDQFVEEPTQGGRMRRSSSDVDQWQQDIGEEPAA
jgi:hypothetical protein